MHILLLTGWALAAGLLALWMRARWRLQRLLRWSLRDTDSPPPQVGGAHGELAYRMQRSLRRLDALRRLENERTGHFLAALEVYPNGLLLLDADDRIQWVNAVAAEHLGLDHRRDLAHPVRHLVREPAFMELLQQHQGHATLARDTRQLHLTLRRFGQERSTRMSLLLTQDVTERLRVDRMRRDFVANVSHELRSPLTVLIGFLDALDGLPLSSQERQQAIQRMRQQADRLQSLVTDLLTLASLEGAAAPPTDYWISLQDLFLRCHSDARLLDGGRHPLSADTVDAHLQLAGNEREWVSALGNLLQNAIRYTPPQGAIHLAWRRLPDQRGEISVLDSGPGIPAEHLPRLTERFYRVDASRSRDTGGTGLGLAIVKHITQRHGAELAIESQPGHGSQFRIRIPAHRLRNTPVNRN